MAGNDKFPGPLVENYFINTYFSYINKSYASTEAKRHEYVEFKDDYLNTLRRAVGGSEILESIRRQLATGDNVVQIMDLVLGIGQKNLKTIHEIVQDNTVNFIIATADIIMKISFLDNLGQEVVEKNLSELLKRVPHHDLATKANILNFMRDGAEFFDKPELAANYLHKFCTTPELFDALKNHNSKDYLQMKNILNKINNNDPSFIELAERALASEFNPNEEILFNKLLAGVVLMEYRVVTGELAAITELYKELKIKLNEFAEHIKAEEERLNNDRHANFISFTKMLILAEADQEIAEEKYNKMLNSILNGKTINSYFYDSINKATYVFYEEYEKIFNRFAPKNNREAEKIYDNLLLNSLTYLKYVIRTQRLKRFQQALMNYIEYRKTLSDNSKDAGTIKDILMFFTNGVVPTDNGRDDKLLYQDLCNGLIQANEPELIFSLLNQLKKVDAEQIIVSLEGINELWAKIVRYRYADLRKNQKEEQNLYLEICAIDPRYQLIFAWKNYLKNSSLKEKELLEFKAKLSALTDLPEYTVFLLGFEKGVDPRKKQNELLSKIELGLAKAELSERIKAMAKTIEIKDPLAILDKLLEQEIKSRSTQQDNDISAVARNEQIYKYDTFAQLPENTEYEDLIIQLNDQTPLALLLKYFELKTKIETTDKKRVLVYIAYDDIKINGFLDERGTFVVPGSNGFKHADIIKAFRNLIIDLSNLKYNRRLQGVPETELHAAKEAIFADLDYSPEVRRKMLREYGLLDSLKLPFKFVELDPGRNPFDADYFLMNEDGLLQPLTGKKKEELQELNKNNNVYYVRYIEQYSKVINMKNPAAKCSNEQIDKYIAYRLREAGKDDSGSAIEDYRDDLQLGIITDDENLFYNEQEDRFMFAPRKAYYIYDEAGKILDGEEFATTFVSGYFKLYKINKGL